MRPRLNWDMKLGPEHRPNATVRFVTTIIGLYVWVQVLGLFDAILNGFGLHVAEPWIYGVIAIGLIIGLYVMAGLQFLFAWTVAR